ncbi:DUF2971 domain-containing protein [Oxalobacteraceae sp. CFBP 8753]|nr:DUF2971 domain-containing protein [Oxalobacteraceae sp. CFBP 8753]
MAQPLTTLSDDAPPVLYKYSPVRDWLPALLKGESLHFSGRTSFNDPFDCRPAFRVAKTKHARDVMHQGLKNRGLSPAKRLMAVNRAFNMGEDALNMLDTSKYLDKVGILCLTPKWDNALMWSHYASNHSGICIGFKTTEGVFRTAMPVVYAKKLPVIEAPGTLGRDLYDQVFMTKFEHWSYEEEWRIIKSESTEEARDKQFRDFCCITSVDEARAIADQRGATNYEFKNSSIESLILGMKISASDERFVKDSILAAGLNIPIYRISDPGRTYDLTRVKIS